MAQDILNQFGPGSSQPQAAPHVDGGDMTHETKDMDYKPPAGPKGINDPKMPGLHGNNYGNCGSQGKY